MLGIPVVVCGDLLAEALAQLPEGKRNVILLSYFLGMTDREIGERLNVVHQTISKRRLVTLKELREYLTKDTAQIVQLIFRLYVHEGYGAQRISHYLSEHGITRPDGRDFPNTTLIKILKNRMYVGIIHNGDMESEPIPALQIIDQQTFDAAQELMTDRKTPRTGTPNTLRGQSLLVGNIYCGHCGNKLTLSTSGTKRLMPNGSIERRTRARYQCHFNVRHANLVVCQPVKAVYVGRNYELSVELNVSFESLQSFTPQYYTPTVSSVGTGRKQKKAPAFLQVP